MATFSRRTIRMLGDELSEWSVLATIADLFDDAGIALGRRRPPPTCRANAAG